MVEPSAIRFRRSPSSWPHCTLKTAAERSGFYDDVLPFPDWKGGAEKPSESAADYAKFLGVDSFCVPKGMTPFESIRFADARNERY